MFKHFNSDKLPRIIFIAVLFAGFTSLCSAAATGDLAGKINGKAITREDFFSSYHGHFAMFSYQNGRSPDNDEKLKIFNDTWTDISRAIVLRDYFKKYSISVSRQDVLDSLSKHIPEHILASPRFRVNGKFDKSIYLQSLTTDRPENLAALRNQYKEFLIPIQLLKDRLLEKELLDKAQSKSISRILKSRADMELYCFYDDSSPINLSDGEIEAYYQANQKSYRLKPHINLNYCKIPVLTDDIDRQNSRITADSILTELNRGKTPEELSKSSKMLNIIEHGFVKTSDLPEPEASILAALKDGDNSQPQPEDKGWVIYQKLQSTKTLTLYRSLYIQSIPRSDNLAAPETTAKRLLTLAKSIGLKQAAGEFDYPHYEVEITNPDSINLPADVIGSLKKKLYGVSAGNLLEPLYSSEQAAWLVFEVTESQLKDYQTLNEVRDSIIKILTEARKKGQNRARVDQWLADHSSVIPDSVVTIKQAGYYSSYPRLPFKRLYYEALKAHWDKTPSPVISYNGMLIVPLISNQSQTREKVNTAQIRAAYAESLEDNWFDLWLNEKVKHAKVIKYIAP